MTDRTCDIFFFSSNIYSVLGERLAVCTLNGLPRVYGGGFKQMVL